MTEVVWARARMIFSNVILLTSLESFEYYQEFPFINTSSITIYGHHINSITGLMPLHCLSVFLHDLKSYPEVGSLL